MHYDEEALFSETQPIHPNYSTHNQVLFRTRSSLYLCARVEIKAWICKNYQSRPISPVSRLLVLLWLDMPQQ